MIQHSFAALLLVEWNGKVGVPLEREKVVVLRPLHELGQLISICVECLCVVRQLSDVGARAECIMKRAYGL